MIMMNAVVGKREYQIRFKNLEHAIFISCNDDETGYCMQEIVSYESLSKYGPEFINDKIKNLLSVLDANVQMMRV